VGSAPQLLVTVDLNSLVGHPGSLGGETGWAGPLDPEACRRLACDGALTRVLVTRQHHPGHRASTDHAPATPAQGQGLDPPPATHHPNGQTPPQDPSGTDRLTVRLRAATALLPRPWVGPQPSP
jgi:hypothetical protein